jgi:hypothetical protein
MSLFQKTYPCQSRQWGTLRCPKGVFRGCAPERPALKYRLKFLYALYWWEIVNAEMNNGPQRLTSRP